MRRPTPASLLLAAAALLLAATAAWHAMGVAMVAGWTEAMPAMPAAAIRFVWLSDSIAWAVVAALWGMAAWRPIGAYLGAAALAAVIPAVTAIAILALAPTFPGGWMLAASVVLALAGILLGRRAAAR